MFETSVIQARPQAARSRFSVLTVSVIAHTAIILGAVGMSIASIDFPGTPPDEFSHAPLIASVQIPPPLGDPNGGKKPETTQPREQKPVPVKSTEVTAPPVTPEETKPVDAPSDGSNDVNTDGDGEGTVPGRRGVPWGDEHSIDTNLDLPPVVTVQTPTVEERIYEAHEVKAPVIIHKVEPRYPQSMMRAGVPAIVIIRCIIDKNGNVRDPQVTVSAMPPFNAEVLRAVSQWRFTPGSLNGTPVETYMNLTVRFEVKR